jgi:hypothetical protein
MNLLRTSSPATKPVAFDALIDAARDTSPVSGLTHNFYRYPARFSPKLVRTAIETFTAPGDLVIDPFVGGGTTLVEALALGRDAIGTDISSLATFVTEVKTTLYEESELAVLAKWSDLVGDEINVHSPVPNELEPSDIEYVKHLDTPPTWRLKKAITQALATATGLRTKRLERFARCVTLRTAQWALDGRKRLPTVDDFREMLRTNGHAMVEGSRSLRIEAEKSDKAATIRCLNRSSACLHDDASIAKAAPKLIVTSPPYPGVHVLYHRWQVDGRKETPAPFWIADKLDGDGAAYYTMGSRNSTLNTYFEKLKDSMRSIALVCAPDTIVVQVVAFSQPALQLPRYLSVADDAGLIEMMVPELQGEGDGRLWRKVPNRKWHANQKGNTGASMEVVLFHRKRHALSSNSP